MRETTHRSARLKNPLSADFKGRTVEILGELDNLEKISFFGVNIDSTEAYWTILPGSEKQWHLAQNLEFLD